MAYRYRGTIRDVELDITPDTTQSAVFDSTKCGTTSGHKQHRKFSESPCRPCKDAFNAYYRDLNARRKAGLVVRAFRDDKCGTLAGYSRHVRHDVPLCEPCRSARREYRHAYDARQEAA